MRRGIGDAWFMETNQVTALHESGSIMVVTKRYDLRTLRLLAASGYTHVRTGDWAWEPIATAIDSATPGTRQVFGRNGEPLNVTVPED